MTTIVLGMMACTAYPLEESPAGTLLTAASGPGSADVTAVAAATGIPVEALEAYRSAAQTRGVDWAILAGIGKKECSHGQSKLPGCPHGTANFCGARGPMQFLGNTWRRGTDPVRSGACPGSQAFTGNPIGPPVPEGQEGGGYATDGDGDGIADPWTWLDATHAAARYLVRSGLEQDVRRALRAYNNSDAYVNGVLALADQYRAAAGQVQPNTAGGTYALPVDIHWYYDDPTEFTDPHHDYPAVDIGIPVGEPIYAVASGTVVKAPTFGACGLGVIINGDDGVQYIYCHGTDGGEIVRPNQHVDAGALIMHSGNTGDSTGPHLHFGIRINGQNRCPQNFLVAIAEGRPTNPHDMPASGCAY